MRHYTSYSAQGTTSDIWNGKNSAGTFVADGRFDITITPCLTAEEGLAMGAQLSG